jgi:lipopolysaccharide transport system ATP-binding protein
VSKPIIRVEGLSKQYRIGARERGYRTIREALVDSVLSPFRRLNGNAGGSNEVEDSYIWALKDVSFEVQPGEVLGVIGRNGAGKSTLLKILSRITEPTEGRVNVRGRVASLLEVGTGFHPELTGRENIYLNGAILGMTKAEIDRKFDEIVAFSEVEKFIDTPVKRYSSGMYVRLAFAVAAHLEPEILLVDEVLAVGDLAFQKKCLGKMNQVSRTGRTVLFVSHNMAAIKSLCNQALLFDAGGVACEGSVDRVVDTYVQRNTPQCSKSGFIPDESARVGTGTARIRRVELLNLSGSPISQLYFGQPFRVALTLEVLRRIEDPILEIDVSTLDEIYVTTSLSVDGEQPFVEIPEGWCRLCLELDVHLLPGLYTIDAGIHHASNPRTIDWVRGTLDFTVLNVAETGADRYPFNVKRGFVRPRGSWHMAVPTPATPFELHTPGE